MTENELKNCPFCGGEAVLIEFTTLPTLRHYSPRCKDAKCVGFSWHKFYDREMAIHAWNRRAEDG